MRLCLGRAVAWAEACLNGLRRVQARMFHESMSRDREDGRATGQSSRGTRDWSRGVPERYVAGIDTR